MDVLIVAVGRLKRAPEAELCADYLNRTSRMGRALGIARTEIREIAESRSERAADRLAQEAATIEAAVPAGFQRICLDENGKLLDSREFAGLDRFMTATKKGMKIIRMSFALSLMYNLVGLYFAVTGQLEPVIAAILMPLSSISIVAFTTAATNYIGRKL